MPTQRGFVQQIEVGRAGLVRIFVIHADGTQDVYVIRDLDADPERFNERLSKLAILRDAMDRAEPVEIEFVTGEGGNEIERAVRITRDALAPPGTIQQLAGLVIDVQVTAQNGVTAQGEQPDQARIALLTTTLSSAVCLLDLQAPERLVAIAQLEMLRDAQARSRLARLLVDTSGAEPRIVAVGVDNTIESFGREDLQEVDGFVESLSLLKLPFGGPGALASSFAHVRFTTAPPFIADGNTIASAAFTPITINLLVPKNSLVYDLFEAGLRDNLRMRSDLVLFRGRQPDDTDAPRNTRRSARGRAGAAEGETDASLVGDVPMLRIMNRENVMERVEFAMVAQPLDGFGLAFAAELLAPIASASRPVWVAIYRDSLDRGPDAAACIPGMPTSDLTPMGLRDLRLPFPAVWKGEAYFNHGVYRFQLKLASDFKLLFDGDELCLFDSETEGVKIAHACVEEGCHHVVVEIEAWTCDAEFIMDVYRIR